MDTIQINPVLTEPDSQRMADSRKFLPPLPRLVILLNNASISAPESLFMPLRYATTAAAMDVAVEVHAINHSVSWFRHGAADPALLNQIRQAVALGVEIFVCPVALTEQGLNTGDLIEEVAGVRGAASFLVAGLEPGARFLVF
jgi:predicted peroxiredoxin